jgi:hypothetical protein
MGARKRDALFSRTPHLLAHASLTPNRAICAGQAAVDSNKSHVILSALVKLGRPWGGCGGMFSLPPYLAFATFFIRSFFSFVAFHL